MLIGFGFFFLGSLSDLWLRTHVASLPFTLLDDALVGVAAGLVVFLYEGRQKQNLTACKQAETAALESEERFRLMANTAPVLIWMSGRDRLCNYFNQSWLSFTGRPLETELGDGWATGVHPDDLEMCLGKYAKAFDLRESFHLEYRLRRHDGEYRWISDLGVPRFGADGSFSGYIGSCTDVTELKRAEEALSSVNRRLIEAQEQERTWVARELHDDINQRIALLAVNLGTLAQTLPASQSVVRRKIEEVKKEVAGIGSDIQALSHHLHSSKLDYLGLASAAASFCRECSERHKVEIELKTDDDFPKSIPREISLCLFRVLQEALHNAIKHSGSHHFEVSLTQSPDIVQLTVRDSGIGFDPEKAIRGSGIGLTSMRERLRLVEGQLTIDSQRQVGTTIYAHVPVPPKMKSAAA